MVSQTSAKKLGLVSLAVGVTELVAPKQLEQTMGIGAGDATGVLRVLGVREILHGFDLLMHRNPTPGIWGRVAGDMLDGAVLAVAFAKSRRPTGFATVAAAVAPIVIADLLCAMGARGVARVPRG